jgi:hypothetical protein
VRILKTILALAALYLLASSACFANSIPVKGSSSYGEGDPIDAAFWDLSSGTLSVPGLTGSTMVDCPNQDLSGSTCSSGTYNYLFQISSAPTNATLVFTGITDPGFTYGFIACETANETILCSNTDSTTLSGIVVTDTPGTNTLTLAFTGAFPTYGSGAGTGAGGLTIFVQEQNQNGGPVAPTLSLGSSIVPAPEPGSMMLLGAGFVTLAGTIRRRRKQARNAAA